MTRPHPTRRPIALLGMRCSGKTQTGWVLARRLGWSFVDLDDEVVRFAQQAGHAVSSLAGLITGPGVATFRELEAATVKKLLEPSPRVVLATGGGVVERADNRAWLARVPRVVWLSVPVETLQERLRGGGVVRPALLGDDPVGEVPALLVRRARHYRALAELVIDCGADPPDVLAERILQGLRSEAE